MSNFIVFIPFSYGEHGKKAQSVFSLGNRLPKKAPPPLQKKKQKKKGRKKVRKDHCRSQFERPLSKAGVVTDEIESGHFLNGLTNGWDVSKR